MMAAEYLITIDKIKIFEKRQEIGGDYDYASRRHLKILSYDEFSFIDILIQDIGIVRKGLAA